MSVLVLLCLPAAVRADLSPDILKSLRPNHPRLYVLNDDLPAIRHAIETDSLAKHWHELLVASAIKMLDEPVASHTLTGPRMLAESRAALRRISTLAGLYRLDGDRRFADRARAEMLALTAFDDWNPQGFLDVAECTNAMAIGYDWLFDFLSKEDRERIRAAIVAKGLNEGFKCYRTHHWWTTADHNYAIVCAAGMTVGALAIADEEPQAARKMIVLNRLTMTLPMSRYAPDGGWSESPAYWNYATRYNVYYLSAIQSALGTDFGLNQSPGFAETGWYRICCIGPTGKSFNYGDGAERPDPAPQMLWMSRKFDRPIYAAHERNFAKDRPDIFHLLWFDPRGEWPPARKSAPTSSVFRNVNVASLRSSWDDSRATFVGFKGGDNRFNHSHLDLGTFVLDALGQRWALDLGQDDYNLPGYFGAHRWEYYRLRTEGHNTLTLDGCNQMPDASAPLVASKTDGDRPFAVVDLSDAYSVASRVWRGVMLLGSSVLIQDELELYRPVEIVWNFHTAAKVQIASDGRSVILAIGGEQLKAELLDPIDGASLAVAPATAALPQRQQPDVSNLTLRIPSGGKKIRIRVLLSAGSDPAPSVPDASLEGWSAYTKLPSK